MISLNTENNKKYMWKLHNFFVTFWFLEIAHLWMARILVSDLLKVYMNKIIKDNVYCIDIIIKKMHDLYWFPLETFSTKKEEKTATPVKKTKKTPQKTQQFCSLTLDGIYNYECFAIMI